jgi:hypothetical protein
MPDWQINVPVIILIVLPAGAWRECCVLIRSAWLGRMYGRICTINIDYYTVPALPSRCCEEAINCISILLSPSPQRLSCLYVLLRPGVRRPKSTSRITLPTVARLSASPCSPTTHKRNVYRLLNVRVSLINVWNVMNAVPRSSKLRAEST